MLSKDLIPVCIAYAIAILGAVIALAVLDGDILVKTLYADLVATVIIFAFSVKYKNSSFYDAYWSVIPPLFVIYWALFSVSPDVDPVRQSMVMLLVWLWGIRLTANWAAHWEGMTHEDWRYGPIREKAGKFALLADFFGIHLFPTLIVFLACLPIYAATCIGGKPLNWLDYVAFIVTAGAILIEMTADLQLHAFISNKQPGQHLDTGLWKYSRHPNYFGQFGFWFGLMLFGLAAHPQGWMWIISGSVAMWAMFVFISIPLMDERSVERRPDYAEYMKKTAAFILWPPRS